MIRLILGSRNPHITYGGLVLMIDGAQFVQTSAEHPELVAHLGLADLVILNKVDQIDDARSAALLQVIRDSNDRAPVLTAAHGRIDPALLFDRDGTRQPAPGEQLTLDALLIDQDHHDHDQCDADCTEHLHSSYEAVDFGSERPIDPRRLVAFLESRPVGIYRIKGFVHFDVPGQARKFEVQAVGPHVRFTSTRWAPGESRSTQLVLIGAGIDRDHVRTRLEACVATDGEATDPGSMLGVHRYTVAV